MLLTLKISQVKAVIEGVSNSTGVMMLKDLQNQLEKYKYVLFDEKKKVLATTIENGEETSFFIKGINKYLQDKYQPKLQESEKSADETDLFSDFTGDSSDLFADLADIKTGTPSDFISMGRSAGEVTSYISALPDLVRFLALGRIMGHSEVKLSSEELENVRLQANELPREYTGVVNINFGNERRTIRLSEENPKAFEMLLKLRELADKRISGSRKIDMIIAAIGKQLEVEGENQQYFGKRIGVLKTYSSETMIAHFIMRILDSMENKSFSDRKAMCARNIGICEDLIDVDKHSTDINYIKRYGFEEYVTVSRAVEKFKEVGLLEIEGESIVNTEAVELLNLLEEEGYLYQALQSSVSLVTLLRIYRLVSKWNLNTIRENYGISLTQDEAISVEEFLASELSLTGVMPTGDYFFRRALKTGIILSTKEVINLDPKENGNLIYALRLLRKHLMSMQGRIEVNAKLGIV